MRSPRRLLTAWRLATEAGVLLFEPGAREALLALPGWSTLGFGPDAESEARVLEAVRALELLHREHNRAAHQVNIVATLPVATDDFASTRDSIIDLVRYAGTQLIVLGFGLTDGKLREEMIGAAGRGVSIMVVGERSRGDLLVFARGWPATVPPATFLQLVEPPAGKSALMHAKVIIADRIKALVGSANFSSGGMKTNMELGFLVEGPVVERLCTVVEHLHSSAWLEPLLY